MKDYVRPSEGISRTEQMNAEDDAAAAPTPFDEPGTNVRVLYLGVFTADTMGNPSVVCNVWNRGVTNDTDENTEMRSAVQQMLGSIATYYSEGTLHVTALGKREAYAYDFIREGRWRILVALQSNDDASLSSITDVKERAKDTLLVMWRNFILYQHQEDTSELGKLLEQVDSADPGVRFGDCHRSGPPILITNAARRVSFLPNEDEEDQMKSLIHEQESHAYVVAKRLALLRFFWCLCLFLCIWVCCICIGGCICLAGVLMYSAVADGGNA
jgi:hypothetical protein